MRRAWTAALCLALVLTGPDIAMADTPYRVDDLLALESIGQVVIDPAERHVLVERRRRYDSGSDYAYGSFQSRALSSIMVAPLDRPDTFEPLFEQDRNAGYWMGSFSPSGKLLSVFRLSNRQLNLGVVDMATRTVRWLDIVPDLPIAHPAPSWVDDDHLVVVAFKTRRLPFILSIGNAVQTDLPRLWETMAAGRTTSATAADTVSISSFAANREIVRIDLRTQRSEQIAAGAITDVAVSSRRQMAIVSLASPAVPPTGAAIDPGFVALRHTLDIIGPGHGSPRIRVSDDVLPAMMAWDETGRKLVYVARITGRDWASARYQVATSNGRLAVVQTLQERPVIAGRQSSLVAHAVWAGSKLLVEEHAGDGIARWTAVDVAAPRKPAIILGPGQLIGSTATSAWLRDGSAMTRYALTGKSPPVTEQVEPTGVMLLDPSNIGVRLLDNPVTPSSVVRSNGYTRYVTTRGKGAADSGSVLIPKSARLLAATSHHVVTYVEDQHGVGTLALASHDRPPITLMRTNEYLAERRLPKRIEIKSVLSDGREHSHWLFLPSMTDPTHLPPLVVMEYPGMVLDGGSPVFISPAFFLPPNNVPILVGHGFAVLMPSLPSDARRADPLAALVGDVDSAVDAAIRHGGIDATRIAAFGHSFGGYGALALATRSPRYRGVVAVSGPYDLAAAHGSMAGPDRIRLELGLPFGQDAGWAEGGQANMVVAPWIDPNRYVARSPSFALDRVQTPVLLIHGENDVVSAEQAERAFMGLARLGKDASLVRYWGEGHVIASPANIRDYWDRILSWLDTRFAAAPIGSPPARHQAASQ